MSSVKTRKLDISTILAVVRAQNQSGAIDQWALNETTQDLYNTNGSGQVAINTSPNVFATTNATLTGTGAISCLSVNTTSDQNLKTEIEPLTSNYQEDLIKNLKPIMYRFKHDLENKRLGFIAQEVESLLNEKCALIGNENNVMSLNYLELISPIISVLQNILNRLDKLEETNSN